MIVTLQNINCNRECRQPSFNARRGMYVESIPNGCYNMLRDRVYHFKRFSCYFCI